MSGSRPSNKDLKDMEIKNINKSLRALDNGQYNCNSKPRRILTKEEQKNLNAAQQTALLDMPDWEHYQFLALQYPAFYNNYLQ